MPERYGLYKLQLCYEVQATHCTAIILRNAEICRVFCQHVATSEIQNENCWESLPDPDSGR